MKFFLNPVQGNLPQTEKSNIWLAVGALSAPYVAPNNPLPGWHSPKTGLTRVWLLQFLCGLKTQQR
jgi:hypothetical protein